MADKDQNRKERGFFKQVKKPVVIVSLIAGLVGGGVASAGALLLNENTNLTTQVAGKNTKVKVNSSNVEGKSAATKAFNIASPAVVSVINLQKSSSLSDYGNSNSDDSDLQTASEGSGVIYKKSGGHAYIVTNNHVVSGSNAVQVLLANGTKLSANIVGTDAYTDLAVLSVADDKIDKLADFANSDELQSGQSVLAIGSPLGTDYATSVTEGIISAPKRTVEATDENGNSLGNETVIQTDAAINPGNSGGALINLAGQVVGINSMKLSSSQDGTAVEGMGFAIPSNVVVKIINELEEHGSITRPGLGISMYDLSSVSTDEQQSVLNLPSSISSGVVVMDVDSNSPASRAGLQRYDVITKLAGKEVNSSAALRAELYEHKVGDTISVTYYRDGKEHTANVHLNQKATQSESGAAQESSAE